MQLDNTLQCTATAAALAGGEKAAVPAAVTYPAAPGTNDVPRPFLLPTQEDGLA